MIPLLVASVAVAGAAFFDGLSTVRFLKNPKLSEQNPLFGLHPSSLRVFGEGAAIIAGEVSLAVFLTILKHPLEYIWAAVFAVQTVLHICAALNNYRLPVK